MLVHFLAESEMKRSIPLTRLCVKYESRTGNQLAYPSIKNGSRGENIKKYSLGMFKAHLLTR